MKRFVRTWWATIWVGACTLGVIAGVAAGGKVYGWEIIVWACNCTAWTVLAEVRYRTGKNIGRLEESERQKAWWH